jgi:VCBS repeat-containing protein
LLGVRADRWHPCNADGDCNNGNDYYCEDLVNVCLPGARVAPVDVNRTAFPRSALILAANGQSAEGTFVVTDPDNDDIEFPLIVDEVISGYGTISVLEDGTWRFTATGTPTSPHVYSITAIEHASDGDHDVVVNAFVVVVDDSADNATGLLAWNGSTSEAMDEAANWTPAVLPTSAHSILLQPGTRSPRVDRGSLDVADVFALAVDIERGSGALTVHGRQFLSNATWASSIGPVDVVNTATLAGTLPALTLANRGCVVSPITAPSITGDLDVRGSTAVLTGQGGLGALHVTLDGAGDFCGGSPPRWRRHSRRHGDHRAVVVVGAWHRHRVAAWGNVDRRPPGANEQPACVDPAHRWRRRGRRASRRCALAGVRHTRVRRRHRVPWARAVRSPLLGRHGHHRRRRAARDQRADRGFDRRVSTALRPRLLGDPALCAREFAVVDPLRR